jgi:formylglycine-generating enzyme required for sulfatase activity
VARFEGCQKAPLPVGSLPEDVNPTGALDMAGNVSEWVLTTAYDGEKNVDWMRGGSFRQEPEDLSTTFRTYQTIGVPGSNDYGVQRAIFAPN